MHTHAIDTAVWAVQHVLPQVLRYMDGQKYDAHWDWFDDPLHGHGKDTEADNRVATVLMYLGEVEEGGETSLPLAELIDPKRQVLVRPSECAKKGTLAVRPKKGDALLFWDILPDGKVVDRSALHASCPTLKGTKWTATKWWVAAEVQQGWPWFGCVVLIPSCSVLPVL